MNLHRTYESRVGTPWVEPVVAKQKGIYIHGPHGNARKLAPIINSLRNAANTKVASESLHAPHLTHPQLRYFPRLAPRCMNYNSAALLLNASRLHVASTGFRGVALG